MPIDWSGFLGENPMAAYMGRMPQFGTPNVRSFYEGAFNPVYNRYLGMLGQGVMAGETPTTQFSDWLKNYPWLEEFYKMSPYQRGENKQLFAPRARWLTY